MRRDIEFRTEDGVILRGWHYLPEGAGPKPTVVMSHGYSAVKEMYLDRFAEAFAEAGIGVLVFDNRKFWRERRRAEAGDRSLAANPGLPRRHHLGQRPSGGECRAHRHLGLKLQRSPCSRGRRDRPAGKCVVAQVPLISGHANARRLIRADLIAQVQAACLEDRRARYQGKPRGVGKPNGACRAANCGLVAVVH